MTENNRLAGMKSDEMFPFIWFDRLRSMQLLLLRHGYKFTGVSFLGWNDETMNDDQKALLLDEVFMAEQVKLTAEDVKGLLVNWVAGFIDVDKDLDVWVDGRNARVTLCDRGIHSIHSAYQFFIAHTNLNRLGYLINTLTDSELLDDSAVLYSVKHNNAVMDDYGLTDEALVALDGTLNPNAIVQELKRAVVKARIIQALVKEQLPNVVVDLTITKCRVELWIDINNDGNKELLSKSQQITDLLPNDSLLS